MKKLIVLLLCLVLSGCTIQKEKFPQTFEEAEEWFDEQHKPLNLKID